MRYRKSSVKIPKVLVVGSSKLPVPAVMGGAVPTLIEELLLQNEKEHKMDFTCVSNHNVEAESKAKKFVYTNFLWIDTPKIINGIDGILYSFSSKVLHISRLLSLSYFFRVMWFTYEVAKYLKKGSYDYVIFENSIPVLHSLRLFGNRRKYNGKYFLHIHTVPRHYYLNKNIIMNCKRIITISEFVKNKIIKKIRISDNKFSILYNSIDTDLFKPYNDKRILNTKKRFNIPNNKKIILFAGRICKDKGIDHVIKAKKQLNDDSMLLIVGSNFYKTSITSEFEKKLIDDTNEIRENVIFTGYVDYKDMPYIYNCADIIVLPSMWEEPAGMTIIEGMACKKVVITTISGGIPEYTGEGNCILLKKDDNISENIAKSIERINADTKYSELLANNAYNWVRKFNVNYYYNEFVKIVGVVK